MSNVTPLRTCVRCGGPATVVTLEYDGRTADLITCDDCLRKTTAKLDRVRPVFKKMIEIGISSEAANETMMFLLGRMTRKG